MENEEMLRNKKLSKLIINFTLPAIGAMVVISLFGILNRIFIGRGIGEEALSGIALTSPITMMIAAFSLLTATGVAVMVSIKLGEQKENQVNDIIHNALFFTMIEGLLLFLIIFLFLKPILLLFGGEGNTLDMAQKYMRVASFSIVFQVMAYMLNYTIRAKGKPVFAFIIIFSGEIINALFNALFIFVFNLGIEAVGYSLIISQLFMISWLLIYFTNYEENHKISFSKFKVDYKMIKLVIVSGLPALFLQGLSSMKLAVANKVVFDFGGSTALATLGIISVIYTSFPMVINGIGYAISPIIGHNYGALNLKRVKNTIKIGMSIGTAICIIGFIVVMFFNERIISIFLGSDYENIKFSATALKYVCITLPLLGIEEIVSIYYQAIGKYRMSIFINSLRHALIIIPLLVVLPRFLGVMGSFVAFPLADTITFFVVIILLVIEFKKLSRKSSNNFKETIIANEQ